MKAVNIIAIVASIAAFILAIYYMEEVYSVRWRYWDSLDYGSPWYQPYYGPTPSEVTFQGALVMMLITLFIVFVNIGNMVKVKTITSKVLSIIGLSLVGIVFFVNLATLAMPGDMYFTDGLGPIYFIFSPISLAFAIVFVVQSFRKPKGTTKNQQTIDDIEQEIV